MSWSLGETKALAIKAARGGGLPWGMAEEAGFAVHWLQSHGAPGAAALAAYLNWRDAFAKPDHDLCPICLGTAISDAGRGVPEWLSRVRQPLLLVPFIVVSTPVAMQLRWDNVTLSISELGLAAEANRDALLTDEADCFAEPAAVQAGQFATRVPDGEADAIATLTQYAARTYAPATEASRMSGAGAGTSDND